MSAPSLPPRFDPAAVEARWQKEWDARGYFRAPTAPPSRGRFSLVLPPPNVTGVLTLGHMLGGTVMDVLTRWHRMQGRAVLWLPGVDHAGLATQVEVRKRLAKEGVRLETLSREEAIHRVQTWKEEHEARIHAQWRAAGFSLDPTRYRYTMDPGFVRATRRAFVTLYNAGLVYRGERIVNWDPKLRTAISDLEVEHREERGTLVYLLYPWADAKEGGLVVATVRPETIFGDVAVAVHPDDPRHAGDVGRKVRVPLTQREVPVIADAAIDREFGTGALKVTPRHDALDFDIFRRSGALPLPPTILDPAGHLTGDWVPERFRGLDRDAARVEVTEALRETHLLVREEPYVHAVGRSERSEAVVEPMLSTQWFVRMAPLASAAVEAVEKGQVRFHPERWNPSFFRWMEKLEDWCISRQIVWGHPIPVYTCGKGHEFASESSPSACPRCGSTSLEADPDVLDTWFSSWLWPFGSLGWPEATADLEHYFPTDVLVTGRDIMFFWVARMMMAGYYFLGKPPFRDVYFTGMLRDEKGRRMSKHLGNSPDPIDVVRARGADAMRFALLFPNPTDQDGPFGTAALDGARNFLTKVWNLARLVLQHTPPGTSPPTSLPPVDARAPIEDRWILSRWRRASEETEEALRTFEFTRAAQALHGFLWHDLADWYVETSKPALAGRKDEPTSRRTRAILLFLLERALRRLHPLVPHVTEELWHALPHEGESLAIAAWPPVDEAPADPQAELAMQVVIDIVRALRTAKSEGKVPAAERPEAWVRPASPEVAHVLADMRETAVALAQVGRLTLLSVGEEPPAGTAPRVTPHGEVFLRRAEATADEAAALRREREKLAGILEKARGRLADPGFRSRAPAEVVREAEEKAEDLEARVRKIDLHLKETGADPGEA